MRNALKTALGDKPIQMEINQGIIAVKDEKGEYLFSLKGKVRVETKLRECERCNSEGRKKELEALAADRKELMEEEKKFEMRQKKHLEHETEISKREDQLQARQKEIKRALKTLCKD